MSKRASHLLKYGLATLTILLSAGWIVGAGITAMAQSGNSDGGFDGRSSKPCIPDSNRKC